MTGLDRDAIQTQNNGSKIRIELEYVFLERNLEVIKHLVAFSDYSDVPGDASHAATICTLSSHVSFPLYPAPPISSGSPQPGGGNPPPDNGGGSGPGGGNDNLPDQGNGGGNPGMGGGGAPAPQRSTDEVLAEQLSQFDSENQQVAKQIDDAKNYYSRLDSYGHVQQALEIYDLIRDLKPARAPLITLPESPYDLGPLSGEETEELALARAQFYVDSLNASVLLFKVNIIAESAYPGDMDLYFKAAKLRDLLIKQQSLRKVPN